jgi:hypothetical protein
MLNLPGQIKDPNLGARLRGRLAIAEFLGIHPRTVDEWRKRGLPIHKPVKEVEAWTEELIAFLRKKQ